MSTTGTANDNNGDSTNERNNNHNQDEDNNSQSTHNSRLSDEPPSPYVRGGGGGSGKKNLKISGPEDDSERGGINGNDVDGDDQQYQKAVYRGGFSSSICDLFNNPSRRSDFCALACCGLLLNDRNEYILTKKPSWPWWFRVMVSVGVPLVFLIIMDILSRALGGDSRRQHAIWQFWTYVGVILITSILLLCFRVSRARVRVQVMERMYRERNDVATHEETLDAYLDHHNMDIWFAHATIGWYPNDISYVPVTSAEYEYEQHRLKESGLVGNSPRDCCSCLWSFFKCICCGYFCNLWFMCCGMCAIGQEDREIAQLVPKSELLIDYITFEPFMNYYSRICDLHNNNVKWFYKHVQASSKLSKRLILMFLGILFLLGILAISRVDQGFQWDNLIIVVATFMQTFIILHFVHWRYHRFTLSFDAIVKYFASGFTICFVMTWIYEMMVATFLHTITNIIVTIGLAGYDIDYSELTEDDYSKLKAQFYKKHVAFFAYYFFISTFLNAFLIAAFTEELMKYFCFWIVEHPDFTDPQDLQEQIKHQRGEIMDKTTILDDSNNASQESAAGEEASAGSTHQSNRSNTSISKPKPVGVAMKEKTVNIPKRSRVDMGAAITIAMVATSLGFSCCENLLYIFERSEHSVAAQWETLITRSLFPVHALCAAIQSIGVVRREVEKIATIGIGRILLPAIMLHGFFDFVLMLPDWIDFMRQLDPDNNLVNPLIPTNPSNDFEELPEEGDLLDLLIMMAPFSVLVAIIYYDCRAEAQHQRLAMMDYEEAVLNRRKNKRQGGDQVEEGLPPPPSGQGTVTTVGGTPTVAAIPATARVVPSDPPSRPAPQMTLV